MFDFLKSPGKVEIVLEKMSFNRPDTLKGKVTLNLNEPKDSNGMRLRLWGEKKVPYTNAQGRTSTRTESVYEFKTDLDVAKLYPAGDSVFEFELQIPAAPQQDQSIASQVAQGVVLAQQMMNNPNNAITTQKPPRWYLEANLDISGGRDPTKRIELNVA